MSRTEALNRALNALQTSSADIEACAVVSEDGLIIASSLPRGFEEAQIAAMSAALLSIGSRTALELGRGRIQQLMVRGEEGYVVLMHGGPNAVLLAMARKEAKLGLVFFDLSKAAEEVRKVLV
jgi:hypothetical protein